jgi:hypothetical protein
MLFDNSPDGHSSLSFCRIKSTTARDVKHLITCKLPRYVPNTVILSDLQIPTVKEEIRRYSSQYSARLSAHPNDLVVNLMELPDNKTPAK